jgi:predicted component of type VI protein secretion system
MQRLKERDALEADPAIRPTPSLRLITEGGERGDAYPLDRSKVTIGRSRADITFPHDGFMSGLHARIVERGGRYYLVDENSRNGTFIRIHDELELRPGDMLIVGKQVFRFEKR